MSRWRNLALVLAIPITILLNLWLGRLDDPQSIGDFNPPPPPDVAATLQGAKIPEQHEMEVRFFAADGSPAVNALVVAMSPDLVSAHTDEDGMARLAWWSDGKAQLMAWLPGHRVFKSSEFDAIQKHAFKFLPLHVPDLESATMLEERQVQVMCTEEDSGKAISGSILLLAAEPDSSPVWLAISGINGTASFDGVTQAGEDIRLFAPDMPPQPEWELAITREGSLLLATCANLELGGMEADTLLSGERWFEGNWFPLPLRLADTAGTANFRQLPHGNYRFDWNGRTLEFALSANSSFNF